MAATDRNVTGRYPFDYRSLYRRFEFNVPPTTTQLTLAVSTSVVSRTHEYSPAVRVSVIFSSAGGPEPCCRKYWYREVDILCCNT